MTSNDYEALPQRLVVLIPVYNDWAAVRMLLFALDTALADAGVSAVLLIVDDASTVAPPSDLARFDPRAITSASLLSLRRNLGHQRAIAIGLTYVEENVPCDAVIVMDGDGEDDPRDVPRLLEAMAEGAPTLTFAARRKRSEGFAFRIFYGLYRALHLVVTGIPVNVGNFSAVPATSLRRMVVVSELWNHYAAAVFQSRIPYRLLPTRRANRLAGTPSMNFVALVSHGLSALAVHGEQVGVRLLVATLIPSVIVAVVLVGIVALRLFTTLAIPGWASTIGGLALVLLTQLLVLAAMFTMFTLNSRAGATFIPLRDYHYFIDREEPLTLRAEPMTVSAFHQG
jgi:hypothetical protein